MLNWKFRSLMTGTLIAGLALVGFAVPTASAATKHANRPVAAAKHGAKTTKTKHHKKTKKHTSKKSHKAKKTSHKTSKHKKH